jgi:hypothetical protein
MMEQARRVHQMTLQRTGLHQLRWRSIQVPYAKPRSEELRRDMPVILAALDSEVAAIAAARRAAARPAARHYKLERINADSLSASGVPAAMLPAGIGPNLALGKPWVSSAPNSSGMDRGLTDENDATVYATDPSPEFPKNVTIDLGAARTVGHIVVGVPDFGSTKTVAVSVSADGTEYKEVGRYDFSMNKAEQRLFNIEPQPARHVRLAFIKNHEQTNRFNNRYCFATGVRVYAPAR